MEFTSHWPWPLPCFLGATFWSGSYWPSSLGLGFLCSTATWTTGANSLNGKGKSWLIALFGGPSWPHCVELPARQFAAGLNPANSRRRMLTFHFAPAAGDSRPCKKRESIFFSLQSPLGIGCLLGGLIFCILFLLPWSAAHNSCAACIPSQNQTAQKPELRHHFQLRSSFLLCAAQSRK